MTTISEQKRRIRDQGITVRKEIPPHEKKMHDAAIGNTVLSLPELNKAVTICLYLAKNEEVETRNIISALLTRNKIVAVPKIIGSNIALYKIQSLDEVAPGAFSVDEPSPHNTHIASSDIDLFIVPGTAFDIYGNRLGWGKGYYDTVLKNVTVPKIGLAFSCQIVPHIPHDSYDILMTAVVTEKEVIWPEQKK